MFAKNIIFWKKINSDKYNDKKNSGKKNEKYEQKE